MSPQIPYSKRVSIIDYGADPRGSEDSTQAINNAIEAVHEENGGVVYIPPGLYKSRTIILRSNVTLIVDKDATIRFSTNYSDYEIVETRREGIHQCQVSPLIFGKDVRNVQIIGEGVFDGQGHAWWPIKRFRVTEDYWNKLVASGGIVDGNTWWPTANALEGSRVFAQLHREGKKPTMELCSKYRDFLRPQLLQIYNGDNIIINGPTFMNSPMWTIHILYSSHVTVVNTKSIAPDYSPNTDGLVIDSSSDVYVRGCLIDVGDDCLVIKSGKDEEGRRIGIPSSNITIDNCVMKRGHGGVAIGSEMSGGVYNVSVTNSRFEGTERGIRIKTQRGRGGVVENIIFRNISMKNIIHEAIVIDMFYTQLPPEPVSERTPVIRGIYISNVVGDNAEYAVRINGLPEMPVEDVVIENTRINSEKGVYIRNATGLRLVKVKVWAKADPVLDISGVRGLELNDVDAIRVQ